MDIKYRMLRFEVEVGKTLVIDLDSQAVITRVEHAGGSIVEFWASVMEPDQLTHQHAYQRVFGVVGTGSEFSGYVHGTTTRKNGLVWHLVELNR